MNKKTLGFTLPEMIVGLAVFSIAVIVLTQSITNALLSLSTLDIEDEFNKNIHFILQEIVNIDKKDVMEEGGTIESIAFGEVKWKVAISNAEIPDFLKLDIDLEFKDEENNPETFELYIYRKEFMDSGERSDLMEKLKLKLEEKDES